MSERILTGAYPENDYRDYLEHHGILGMKWGVRRYQNKDGSLTSAGKNRYKSNGSIRDKKLIKKAMKNLDSRNSEIAKIEKTISSEIDQTEEKKSYDAFKKFLDDLNEEFEEKYPGSKLEISKDVIDTNIKLSQAYVDKSHDIKAKYSSKISKEVIKKAGVPETKENLEFAESEYLKANEKSRKRSKRALKSLYYVQYYLN